MSATRKPAAETFIPRAYPWRPWVDEFLTTKGSGDRSAWLNDLVEVSPEFRAWWNALEEAKLMIKSYRGVD